MSVGSFLRSVRDLGRFFQTENDWNIALDKFRNSPMSGIFKIDQYFKNTATYSYDLDSNLGLVYINNANANILMIEHIMTTNFEWLAVELKLSEKEIAQWVSAVEVQPKYKAYIAYQKYYEYVNKYPELATSITTFQPKEFWDNLTDKGKENLENLYKNLKNYFSPEVNVQSFLGNIDLSLAWSIDDITPIIENLFKAIQSHVGVFYCDKNTRYKATNVTCQTITQPFEAYDSIDDLNELKSLIHWSPYTMALEGNINTNFRQLLEVATGETLPENIIDALNSKNINYIFQEYARDGVGQLTINLLPASLCSNIPNTLPSQKLFMMYRQSVNVNNYQHIDLVDYTNTVFPVVISRRNDSLMGIISDLAIQYDFDPFNENNPSPGDNNNSSSLVIITIIIIALIIIVIVLFFVFYLNTKIPESHTTIEGTS